MFQNANDARNFILAGNAVVTLESATTGQHYTYRVRQATDQNDKPQNRWFVSLLIGPDNTSDYSYIGLIDRGQFRLTAKSKLPESAAPVAGFRFAWRWLSERAAMPPQMEIRHEGRCGRCHRPLTVPESIDRGLGPECSKKAA